MVGLEQELKSKVRGLWDKFWSGGISNPLQAIEQISYLIYMKKLEDKDVLEEQNAILKGKNSILEKKSNIKSIVSNRELFIETAMKLLKYKNSTK